jgi:trehalose/maltose hydrolase-like predicted phosphorylase
VAIDLADNHTTIAGGLHMAALGGTWLTAVFGFAGLSMQRDGIAFNPKLPASWRTLKFGIKWLLGIEPTRTVVIEDAISGIQAGCAGSLDL